MSYEITIEHRGVYKRFWGVVTAAEFEQAIAEVQNLPDFDRLRYTINDFSAVTAHDITPQDVTLFVAYGLGAQFSNAKVQLLIVTDQPSIIELVSTNYAPRLDYPLSFFARLPTPGNGSLAIDVHSVDKRVDRRDPLTNNPWH